MSSKIQLELLCELCKKEFIAKTTRTRFCSHNCARNSHKIKVRNANIASALARKAELKGTKVKQVAGYNEIKEKELLTIDEASKLLNISVLTLRRWLKAGKISSSRIGKKHLIKRLDINTLLHN